jgi:capsular polysaccharide transport system permease protein
MGVDDSGLDLEDDSEASRKPGTALERIRQVSQALSDAARRSRMSARARKAYSGGGFQARRGAKAVRWAVLVSFFVMVAAPSLAGALYYGFVAADQFVSVADFTVSGGEAPAPDGLGALTGIPAVAVIQDTQIVVNYIHSRAAVEVLQKTADIKDVYANPKADRLVRFNPKKPIENFVKYWEGMSDASIKMPAGIVELRIRAFTPEDARRLAQATLDACEGLINDMNDRVNRDAVANAEQELQRSANRLAAAQAALEKARNESGLLDATKSAEALNKLVNDTRASLLKMQEEYGAQLKSVSDTAPQMRELKSRIDVTQAQIAEIESKLTSTQTRTGADSTIAGAMTTFGELDLERQIAERLYAGAAASLELARVNAERKMMYFKTFVSPVAAQEAQYPKRALYAFLIFVGCLALWGALCGLALTVRNYMA